MHIVQICLVGADKDVSALPVPKKLFNLCYLNHMNKEKLHFYVFKFSFLKCAFVYTLCEFYQVLWLQLFRLFNLCKYNNPNLYFFDGYCYVRTNSA